MNEVVLTGPFGFELVKPNYRMPEILVRADAIGELVISFENLMRLLLWIENQFHSLLLSLSFGAPIPLVIAHNWVDQL